MSENGGNPVGIVCSNCTAMNPRNRLTCEACGERLSPGSTKLFDSPAPEKKKRSRTKKEPKMEDTEDSQPSLPLIGTNPAPAELPPPPQPKHRKRTKRHVPTKPEDPIFFVLDGSKLKPIKINWGVIRPLRRKDISQRARSVLSLYNRSKDLLK